MSKERKFLNIGLSLAFSSATIASCKGEPTFGPDVPETVAEPGKCEIVTDTDIRVCNLSHEIEGTVVVQRRSNQSWENIGSMTLREKSPFELDKILDGMWFYLDRDLNLHIKVEEPLASATPIPTSTPLPTPFRFEPQNWENGTA